MEPIQDPDELEGLRPEDVPIPVMSEAELAQVAEQIIAQSTDPNEPQINLHDSEVTAAAHALVYLQSKYGHRPATYPNLLSMKGEAESLFEKMGLQVVVDWVGPALKVPPEPPIISIVGRLTEFDLERHGWEVKRGVADEFYKGQ
jgi:hypothetical protein